MNLKGEPTVIPMSTAPPFAEPIFVKSRSASAKKCLGTFGKGGRVVGLTAGQFSLLDLLRAVVDLSGPADVVISTWSAGIRDIDNARWLLKSGAIRTLALLVDRSFPSRKPRYTKRLVDYFGLGAIRVSRNHAKFALIQNDDWDVCIRSSMNLNRNDRYEQFDVDESRLLCDFFGDFYRQVFKETPEGMYVANHKYESIVRKALAEGARLEEEDPDDDDDGLDWLEDLG